MKVIVTGAGGLIGSQASNHYLSHGHEVYGIENNMRSLFFGEKGDVTKTLQSISAHSRFTHVDIDIRDRDAIESIISKTKPDVIIHTAAQPSHDKAADIPYLDFETNAVGTLNLLESTRRYAADCVFIHVSTNKVYGDSPNNLPIVEKDTRYDFDERLIGNYTGASYSGISEKFSIDNSMHSLFGASKLAADVLAQEYGKYFEMNVGIFRGGCLTGPQHAGVELHGFLSYIVQCALRGNHYNIFGYKGKQVRDQIHCADVISCFNGFVENPKMGEVYNLGGGRENAASVLEVVDIIENISGKRLNFTLTDTARKGDHVCYMTDMRKYSEHYTGWKKTYSLKDIIEEMVDREVKNV